MPQSQDETDWYFCSTPMLEYDWQINMDNVKFHAESHAKLKNEPENLFIDYKYTCTE